MKIRTRITLWITLACASVGLAFSLYVFWEMAEQSYRHLDNELKMVIRDVYSAIRQKNRAIAENELFFANRHYWIKVWRGEKLIYRSILARSLKLTPTPGKKKETLPATLIQVTGNPDLQQFRNAAFRIRTAVIPATMAPPGYRISVAMPMKKLNEEINEVICVMVLGLAGAALILALLSWFLAGRILKPIQEITDLAQQINSQKLTSRIPVDDNRDELSELSRALNQMLDRLQFSFKQQKEFIASAAHEFKTPVTNLRLLTEQALNDPGLSETTRKSLSHQHDTLLSMGRLLRNLMVLSTLEMKQTVVPALFDFKEMLASVLTDFAALFEFNEINLSTRFPEQLLCLGDEEQLRRAVVNLIENAVKYNCRPGEIRIELDRKKEDLILQIHNRVPEAIPEEELEKLFTQFYRLEKSRSREFGGCGLGLTIVKEIITLHRGTIRLENRPDNWVTVTIRMPQRN